MVLITLTSHIYREVKDSRFIFSLQNLKIISFVYPWDLTRDRPKFGFGFGAERRQMASFGIVSVSAEANKLVFSLLLVSVETDIDFRSSAEYLF
jgi:hypothetical protein